MWVSLSTAWNGKLGIVRLDPIECWVYSSVMVKVTQSGACIGYRTLARSGIDPWLSHEHAGAYHMMEIIQNSAVLFD